MDESQRLTLIHKIWQLKVALGQHGVTEGAISLKQLLKDAQQREQLLKVAEGSDDARARAIAADVRRLDPGGAVAASSVELAAARQSSEWAGGAARRSESGMRAADRQQERGRSGRSAISRAAIVVPLFGLIGGAAVVLSVTLFDGVERVVVEGKLVGTKHWPADKTYVLRGLVSVEAGSSLEIEPGTRILGERGSTLIVGRGAQLRAEGTAAAPIVFTSAQPVGQRRPGDWGGVVLLGRAPVNRFDARMEGLPASLARGYGGGDSEHNCGSLRYVRIEFAGYELAPNSELNGLTLAGCGRRTLVRNVQVHRALDDGVELFGGNVDLSRVVVTQAQDDGLDWQLGYTGRIQFLVVQQGGEGGDAAIEADNLGENHNAKPRSAPTISNITLIGSGDPTRDQRGMVLRRGTGGTILNALLIGFPVEAIDIRDISTASLIGKGDLEFAGLAMHASGGGRLFERETGTDDDDGGFDESEYFSSRVAGVDTRNDPLLPRAALDPAAPVFVPQRGSPLADDAAPVPQGEFWDEAARFIGAFRPGAGEDWTAGWTAYPVD